MEVSANFNNGKWIAGPFKAVSETLPNTLWFGQLVDSKSDAAEDVLEAAEDGTIGESNEDREGLAIESIQYAIPGYASYSIAHVVIVPDKPNSLIESAVKVLKELCEPQCIVKYSDVKSIVQYIYPFSTVLILASSPIDPVPIMRAEKLIHGVTSIAQIGIFAMLAQDSDLF